MPVNPLDYLKSLFQSNPAQGGGEDIDLPSETFVGPREPKPESSPWQKAATIGASKVGERYAEPTNPTTVDLIRQFAFGPERPRSVAAQDPYGIEAWKIGAGPPPGLMMGSTEEVGGPLKKAVAGLKGFYSRVDNTAEQLPSQMHPVKAESIFKNNAAKEEVDYRGLGDFLKSKTGPKVSKAEIQDHLAANPMPNIEVKNLGEGGWTGVNSRRLDELEQLDYHRSPAEGREFQDLINRENASHEGPTPSPTVYDRTSLNVPGGENYRERLLKLPQDTGTQEEFAAQLQRHGIDNHEGVAASEFNDPRSEIWTNYLKDRQGNYEHSHWPNEINPLAHSRFDERTLDPRTTKPINELTPEEVQNYDQIKQDVNGTRGRFLQEVQSDWHDAAIDAHANNLNRLAADHGIPMAPLENPRKGMSQRESALRKVASPEELKLIDTYGYQKADAPTRMDLAMKADVAHQDARYKAQVLTNYLDRNGYPPNYDSAHSAFGDVVMAARNPQHQPEVPTDWLDEHSHRMMQEYLDANEHARAALRAHNAMQEGVPDAPFKETWPDLVLKEHVMDVAQNPDLNWLGFTTGDTQNQRYDLAQTVRNMDYSPELGKLDVEGVDGDRRSYNVQPEELHQYVGPNMAQRILHNPDTKIPDQLNDSVTGANWHTVNLSEGEHLAIGGEGMTSFYDKKLPSALARILKPFGGKVELGELPGPAPRISATAGRPVYTTIAADIAAEHGRGSPRSYVSHVSRDNQQIASTWPPVPNGPGAAPEAASRGQDLADLIRAQPHMQGRGVPAWIAHLPPEMKKAIMEKGLPLLTLLGMTQMHQSDDQSQAPAGAMQGLKNAR